MGITGITAFRNVARNLSPLVMLAIVSFFYTVQAQAGQVTLAWDVNIESILGGYRLYYGQTSRNYATNVDVANNTSSTVTGLQDGKTYYFAVQAYAIGGLISSGFSNEVSKTIATSTSAPTASFSTDPLSGTAPLTVTFADTSTGNITARSWSFGDGTTSTATYGAKSYSTPGTYTMSLTVTGPGGSNAATRTISVTAAAPVASFTATPVITASPSGGGGGNAGLVGAYNFEEASGTTVVDASGQGNTGTISGATPVTLGRFAKALSFDGVNDRVTINDAPSLDLSTAVTLEAWVYPNLIPGHNIILGKVPQDGSHNYPWFAYSLHVLDTRIPRFSITAGGPPAIVTSPDVLAENVWTHIAGVYDGSTIKIYINGVQKGSVAKTGTILNTTGSLKIGANGANGEPLQGTIDEVRIYNRALSAAEIRTDMSR